MDGYGSLLDMFGESRIVLLGADSQGRDADDSPLMDEEQRRPLFASTMA
ncbi:MAG TPA: hypothetical protein VMM78_06195 [Thermomicrobiales bacterium]|nr:hypothetical protein [Thermomicrobiales bacterium]